jgi:hypothetical protein
LNLTLQDCAAILQHAKPFLVQVGNGIKDEGKQFLSVLRQRDGHDTMSHSQPATICFPVADTFYQLLLPSNSGSFLWELSPGLSAVRRGGDGYKCGKSHDTYKDHAGWMDLLHVDVVLIDNASTAKRMASDQIYQVVVWVTEELPQLCPVHATERHQKSCNLNSCGHVGTTLGGEWFGIVGGSEVDTLLHIWLAIDRPIVLCLKRD